MPESNLWSGRSSCNLRSGSTKADDRGLVISGDNEDNFFNVDALKSKNNVDNLAYVDASKKALGSPANRKTFDHPSLPIEREENGGKDDLQVKLRRLMDEDLHFSNEQGDIISNPTDLTEDKVGEEISTGDEVVDVSEQNYGGQSREQRQSDGMVRSKRLIEVEVSERLGEVETVKVVAEVEKGKGLQEVEVGESLMGEVERNTLKSWLQDFSEHIHLPRAYQVNCLS